MSTVGCRVGIQWAQPLVCRFCRICKLDFGICRLAWVTFLDRSLWVLGARGSSLNPRRVWAFYLEKSFFVVSSSSVGSRKVLHVDMTWAELSKSPQSEKVTPKSISQPKMLQKIRLWIENFIFVWQFHEKHNKVGPTQIWDRTTQNCDLQPRNTIFDGARSQIQRTPPNPIVNRRPGWNPDGRRHSEVGGRSFESFDPRFWWDRP